MLHFMQTLLDDLFLEAGHAPGLSRCSCDLCIALSVSNQFIDILNLLHCWNSTVMFSSVNSAVQDDGPIPISGSQIISVARDPCSPPIHGWLRSLVDPFSCLVEENPQVG